MGTVISIQLPEHKSLFKPSFALFKTVDATFSTYKTSLVTEINKYKNTLVSPLFIDLFLKSEHWRSMSAQKFSVFQDSGNNYRAPHYTINGKIGEENHLAQKDKKSKLSSALSENKIFKLRPPHKLDFGGIAKGYAVDRVRNYLIENNVQRAQISASGDIRCIGVCRLKIQHPLKESSVLSFSSRTHELAISTSGLYRQPRHIIDPKTKSVQLNWLSVTVVSSRSNTDLDAIATAVFNMKKDRALQWLKKLDISYALIDHKKMIYTDLETSGIIDDFKWLDLEDLNKP